MEISSIFFALKSTTIEIPYKEAYSQYQAGDWIILKTDEFKEELGKVQKILYSKRKSAKIDLSAEILRKASERDLQKKEINQSKETDVQKEFEKQVKAMQLDMRMVSAHFSMDDSMVYINFLSDNRVDFRDLVKNIAQKFKKKIHLQQIGPRDKAKIQGGFGLCGQEFCCKRFLTDLPSVTMESVRVQNMAYKGTDKLSGQCGKLMCCLNYESGQYRDVINKFPKFGSSVKYKNKKGIVTGLDVLNEKLKIRFEDHNIESVALKDLEK